MVGDYYSRIVHNVMKILTAGRFGMLGCLLSMLTDVQNLDLPVIERGDVDGALILFGGETTVNAYHILRAIPAFEKRPVVTVMNPIPGCAMVAADDWSGAYAAMSHVLDAGHRHVVHFYNESFNLPTIHLRLAAFRQACQDRGLTPDTSIHYLCYNHSLIPEQQHPYQQRLREYLCRHPEVTAIMPRNDYQLSVVLRVLDELGLRVPDDMSIVGFDDTFPLLDARGMNILTTVRVPLQDIGQQAAPDRAEIAGRDEVAIDGTGGAAQVIGQ